jgi:hypothetical protein
MTRYIENAPTFNQTSETYKTGAYTLTLSDSLVTASSGTFTFTLPAISTMNANLRGSKEYKIVNAGTGVITVASATGETIGGGSSYVIRTANEFIIIHANAVDTDWKIDYPAPRNAAINIQDDTITGAKLVTEKLYQAVAALTTGTTAVDVFGSSGAPAALTITSVFAIAQDTNAGNMILTNGTNAVATFAKSTTAGIVTGEDGALANTAVTSGDTCTVESSTTNGNGNVVITYTVV